MATPIARLCLPALSADSEKRRLSCVLCKKLRPSNGKILHCLHISCLGCIGEMKDDDGYLKCIECLAASDDCLSAENVSNKLVNSVPLLYASRVDEDQSSKSTSFVLKICELCDDEAPGEATHRCTQCEGMLLCTKHAKSHPKVRVYSEHTVESLGEISADSFQPSSTHCIFHNRLDVVTYCLTCCHGVCAQCLANGHDNHTFKSLSSVAKQHRITVEEILNSSPVISLSIRSDSSEAADSSQLPVEAALHDVSEEINSIEKEAQAASCIVTETIGKIETILEAKKENLLTCVDQLRWSQLGVYESKQQRLFALQEKHASLVQVSQQLIDGKVPDLDCILLADIVTSSHEKIAAEMLSERSAAVRQKIEVISTTVDRITEDLDKLLRIEIASGLDMSSKAVAISEVGVSLKKTERSSARFGGRAAPEESTTTAVATATEVTTTTANVPQGKSAGSRQAPKFGPSLGDSLLSDELPSAPPSSTSRELPSSFTKVPSPTVPVTLQASSPRLPSSFSSTSQLLPNAMPQNTSRITSPGQLHCRPQQHGPRSLCEQQLESMRLAGHQQFPQPVLLPWHLRQPHHQSPPHLEPHLHRQLQRHHELLPQHQPQMHHHTQTVPWQLSLSQESPQIRTWQAPDLQQQSQSQNVPLLQPPSRPQLEKPLPSQKQPEHQWSPQIKQPPQSQKSPVSHQLPQSQPPLQPEESPQSQKPPASQPIAQAQQPQQSQKPPCPRQSSQSQNPAQLQELSGPTVIDINTRASAVSETTTASGIATAEQSSPSQQPPGSQSPKQSQEPPQLLPQRASNLQTQATPQHRAQSRKAQNSSEPLRPSEAQYLPQQVAEIGHPKGDQGAAKGHGSRQARKRQRKDRKH